MLEVADIGVTRDDIGENTGERVPELTALDGSVHVIAMDGESFEGDRSCGCAGSGHRPEILSRKRSVVEINQMIFHVNNESLR